MANFDLSLCAFIAATVTSDDRHNLVQQLCTPSKPHALSIRAFFYRLIELNGYVGWMPGEELPLTHLGLKQAFYNGMPPTWRERFVQAGKSQLQVQQADLIRYFHMQEKLAISKANDNTAKQRAEAHKPGRPHHKERHKDLGKSRARHQSKKRKASNNPPKQRIADDSPCPVHPGASHTWGNATSMLGTNVPSEAAVIHPMATTKTVPSRLSLLLLVLQVPPVLILKTSL